MECFLLPGPQLVLGTPLCHVAGSWWRYTGTVLQCLGSAEEEPLLGLGGWGLKDAPS